MRIAAAIGVSAVLFALAAPVAAQPARSYDPASGWKRGPGGSPAIVTAPSRQGEPLVDFRAPPPDARTREPPTHGRVFPSMRARDAQAPGTSRPTQGVSGLYLATVRRLVFQATGGTDWITTTEFYLLSPEGRVQRGYGLPEVPGGDLRRFDYENARRADPGNSGSYTMIDNRVTITIGEERISATLAPPDELEIRGRRFKRSLK
jgi:hypothetical protein